MSARRGPWGEPGRRLYRTGGNPHKRRFEHEGAEQSRQAKYAKAEVRADGEHYWPPTAPRSLEAMERSFERGEVEKASGGFRALLGLTAKTVWHMGMYSSDPEIARMAIVHTAGEQINVQRQLTAQQQQQMAAQHARERAEDAAAADARMMAMARETAKAMFDEADRRRAHS